MKALIFAAGIGSRLKPFTDSHPKALASVGGVPMLERTLLKLKEAGITDVTVNVHHFASQITTFLAANNNFGLQVHISDESSLLLDTGGGLLKAREFLDSCDNTPILLHNADILTDMPIGEMQASHTSSSADASLLASHRKSSRMLYFGNNGMLCGWRNTTTGECRPEGFIASGDLDAMAFGGIHIVQPSLFPLLDEYAKAHGPVFSIIPFYLENLHRLKISGFCPKRDFIWHDIGTPEKLAAAEQALHDAKA